MLNRANSNFSCNGPDTLIFNWANSYISCIGPNTLILNWATSCYGCIGPDALNLKRANIVSSTQRKKIIARFKIFGLCEIILPPAENTECTVRNCPRFSIYKFAFFRYVQRIKFPDKLNFCSMYTTEKCELLDTKTRTVSDCALSIFDRKEY